MRIFSKPGSSRQAIGRQKKKVASGLQPSKTGFATLGKIKKSPTGAKAPGRKATSGIKAWRFIPSDFTAIFKNVKAQNCLLTIYS